MRILVSGASGFIGTALCAHFEGEEHEVVRLSRHEGARTISWNLLKPKELEGFDAVIHLAGEPIFGRWTAEKKRRIFASRVESTRLLAEAFSECPPKCFCSVSAVGYYGDRGEESLTEESSPGIGFLPHVCVEWEKASLVLEKRGVRVVHPRFGTVLGMGGALSKLLFPYKLGLGGPLGSGEQWMSWIALEDLVRAIDFCLNAKISGPINFVSPEPVRQIEFAHALGKALHRPSFFSQPAWLLRLIFGEMAREIFLSSLRVFPQKLTSAGFHFQSADLEQTLQKVVRSSIVGAK